jgi:large subunit ribosomal protein L10
MTREEKNQLIDQLTEQLNASEFFYLTDVSELTVETTHKLRGYCHRKDVKLTMVKNTLLRKAMERADKDLEELYEVLKGSTSLMFAEAGNIPARLIKEFRKKEKNEKPILKGAYIEEVCYVGEDKLELLANIKSKNELVGDLVALLQSPARNVVNALQSGGQTITGVLQTLSERAA